MRVKHIVELMADLKWTRPMGRELAQKWGLSPERVRALSAEASRIVSRDVMDADHVRATCGAALERIITDFDTSDRKSLVLAISAWAKIAGVEAASKVEITTRAIEEFERMPVPERVKYLREKAAALSALADQLEAS